jgi:hypothetical protein
VGSDGDDGKPSGEEIEERCHLLPKIQKRARKARLSLGDFSPMNKLTSRQDRAAMGESLRGWLPNNHGARGLKLSVRGRREERVWQ